MMLVSSAIIQQAKNLCRKLVKKGNFHSTTFCLYMFYCFKELKKANKGRDNTSASTLITENGNVTFRIHHNSGEMICLVVIWR